MFPSSQMVQRLLVGRPHLEHQVLEKGRPLSFWARYGNVKRRKMPACYLHGRMHLLKQNLKALDVITARRMIRETKKLNIFVGKFHFFFMKFSTILEMTKNLSCV